MPGNFPSWLYMLGSLIYVFEIQNAQCLLDHKEHPFIQDIHGGRYGNSITPTKTKNKPST